MDNNEPVVTIKFSQSEVNRLVDALVILKTMIIPVEPEWKLPYKALLNDLRKIKAGISESIHNRNLDEPELLEWKRGGTAGCKTGKCD